MKTVSDDLFRLVKSLNKSEKGFFKKFASKNATGSKQNYIYLFEAIDAQETYNEEEIRRKIKDPSLLKQLPVYKVYLFNLILKAMNLYGAYDNSESQLNDMLANIRILTSKHLYPEAKKIIKKAKALAYKFDKHRFIMELLAAERHILLSSPSKNMLDKRAELYEQQVDLVGRMLEFYTQSLLCDKITILVDHEADYSVSNNTKMLDEIIKDKNLVTDNNITGYYARMNFYHTRLIYSGAKGNMNEILANLKNQIDFDEANSHFIDENPQNYVFTLINYLLYAHYAKDKNKISEARQKLESIKKKIKGKIPRETEIQILFHASGVEMIINEKNCDIPAGRTKIKQIENDLKTYGADVPAHIKALMYVNITCFSIIDSNFSNALKYINKILNDTELTLRSDVNDISRMLEILVHYEMGNYDLIEYLLGSAKKFFASKNPSSKNRELLLKFFAMVIQVNKDEHPGLFDELHFNLSRSKETDVLLTFFDFISWAKSHADGKALIDVMKENSGIKN